jgi:hypothetical protein
MNYTFELRNDHEFLEATETLRKLEAKFIKELHKVAESIPQKDRPCKLQFIIKYPNDTVISELK